MIDVVLAVTALLLKLAGFFFIFSAALGVLRFADPLQRMHAATKSGTVGGGLMVAGAALASRDPGVAVVAAVTVLFLFLTVPVAGHVLGRAIYFSSHDTRKIAVSDELDKALAESRDAGKRTESRDAAKRAESSR